MKICFLREFLKQGGAERAIVSLANSFSKMGHEVFIYLTTEYTPYFELEESVVVREIKYESKIKKLNIFSLIKALRAQILMDSPDCVITFDPYTLFNALCIKRKCGIKVICSERSNPKLYPVSKKWRLIRRLCIPKTDGWVFQTNAAYEYYKKNIKKKWSVIPNAIFNPNIAPLVYPEKREKIICSMGRFHRSKGFQDIIDVLAKLPEEFSDYKLHLYGNSGDYKQTLLLKAQELGLSSRVSLIEGNEYAVCDIASASLFVFASYYEGMPNALMEAMAVGLSCVSYNCEMGPADLIDNNSNGILVPVGDKEKLYSSVLSLLKDEDKAESMGREAYKIREKYTIDSISKSWIEFIKEVCRWKG